MEISDALPLDMPYLRKLQKEESFALGWIPEQIFDRVWAGTFSGWILICRVNQDPVGFCFCAPAYKAPFYGRIYQPAVQADARRYDYGTFLADTAHSLITDSGAQGTTLRCAHDLPSNFFWDAMGWKLLGIIPEGSSVGDSPRKTKRALHKRLKVCMDSLFQIEGFGLAAQI
jgi:hypothetical protein